MSLFEVQSIPGKGKGCVATQDIPAGTAIFMEQPLVRIRDGATYAEYVAAYEALSFDGKAIVSELHGNVTQDLFNSVNDELSQPRADGSFLPTPVKQHYIDVISKFTTNAFSMEDGDDNEDDPGTIGLFPLTSRFNHSCDPNVAYSVEWTPGWWVSKAMRDIKSGEELTIEYIPRVSLVSHREEQLSKWGFTCDCSACIADRQGADTFKELRESMDELDLAGETGPEDDGDDKEDEIQAQYDRLHANIEELEDKNGGIELFFRYQEMAEFCEARYLRYMRNGEDELAATTYGHLIDWADRCLVKGMVVWGPTDALVAEQLTLIMKYKSRRQRDLEG